ncbi:MAG: leucyl aminopeptidase [Actinomycetota bacterium]
MKLSDADPTSLVVDSVVLLITKSKTGPVLKLALPPETRAAVMDALAALDVTGATDEVVRLPAGPGWSARTLTVTGLGDQPDSRSTPEPETVRRAVGAAVRSLTGVTKVAVVAPSDTPEVISATAEGATFGAYAFTRHRSKTAADVKEPVSQVTVLTSAARRKATRQATNRAEHLGAAMTLVRDLVNTAPGDLYPAAFVDIAEHAVADLPIAVTVWDEKALATEHYGGILAVGQGSTRPPRLLRLDYHPDGASHHLALIGKGITFDSGGLSLKPPAGMETMKSDMAGGATVLGALIALAQLNSPVRVTGWIPLAENMPSGSAQRPSDVITIYGGRTVEVLNTDAEGRLVLADALVAASAENPDAIVDIATLTGHQVVALGHRYGAVMGNNDSLRDQVVTIANTAGEQMWPMPLPTELRASMDSLVADIANIGERMGGMMVAGLFLAEFVGQKSDDSGPINWAHLDIAGPSFNEKEPWGYTPKGGTGHGLRTLVALAEAFA